MKATLTPPEPPNKNEPWIWIDGRWLLVITDTGDGVPESLDFSDDAPKPKVKARPNEVGRSNVVLYNEGESRDDHGRWDGGGGGSGDSGASGSDTSTPVTPITASEARGDSRLVTTSEYHQLASEGQTYLANLRANSSPPTGLDSNWGRVKDDAYGEVRKSWGGATYNAHTGEAAQASSGYVLSIKSQGDSVSVHEDATKEEFSAAMDQARTKFADDLTIQDGHLGVFHDDDLHRIDIDPVIVVPTVHEVETVGAATRAIGGAYCFADGNGYWPPHVADTTEKAAARGNMNTFTDQTTNWRGIGEWYANVRKTQHGKPDKPGPATSASAKLGRSAVTKAAFDREGKSTRALGTVTLYSEDQERDYHGRWGSGDGGSDGGDSSSANVGKIASDRVAEAKLDEPALTQKFTELASTHGGHLEGLAFRVKEAPSLEKKINGDVAQGKGTAQEVSDKIYDVNRYTVGLPDNTYTEETVASLDYLKSKGDSLIVKNFWAIPIEENPYQGVNVQGTTKEGVRYELQFHTAISLDVKENQLHALYKAKDTMTPAEYAQKTVAMAASIPVPPGIVDALPVKGEW